MIHLELRRGICIADNDSVDGGIDDAKKNTAHEQSHKETNDTGRYRGIFPSRQQLWMTRRENSNFIRPIVAFSDDFGKNLGVMFLMSIGFNV